jgi:two-component system, response regulator PdtaR
MVNAHRIADPYPSIILVVEDETLTRLMLVEELQKQGHEVIEAADAEEALSVLRKNSLIRLLFTDVKMPGALDGLELARIARAECPRLKVILASAHVDLPEWSADADAVFPKPYDIEALVAWINWLVASGAADESFEALRH